MKKKNRINTNKGRIAILMALAMSLMIPGTLHAATSYKEETPQLYSSDVTKPVIEKIEMEGKGSSVKAGGALPIKIWAYDQDDGIQDISVNVLYSSADNRVAENTFNVSGDAGIDKNYVIEIPAKQGGYVKAEIVNITVTDKNGNYENATVSDEQGQPLYYFTITDSQSQAVAIQSIEINKNKETLNHADNSGISIKVADNQFDNVNHLYANFQNTETKDEYSYDLFNNEGGTETNIYTGTIYAYSNMSNGKWELQSVTADGKDDILIDITHDGINLADYWFNLAGETGKKDTTPPVITSFDMSHKGEFVTAGDVVTFELKATDDGELSQNAYIELTAASDIANKYQNIDLRYDEQTQSYRGEFKVPDTLYPCEWYLNYIQLHDVSGNWTDSSEYINSFNSNPFYIKMKSNDTFTNPVYDLNISFYALNEKGEYTQLSNWEKKQVARRTTLKEAGITIPTVTTSYKGLKFKGWMDERGKKIDENTEITDTMRYMEFYAVYDQMIMPVYHIYPDKNLLKKEDKTMHIVSYGTTYNQLISELKKYTPDGLYDGESFKGWSVNNNSTNMSDKLDSEIKFSPYNSIYLNAEYNNKVIVEVDQSYFDTEALDSYKEYLYMLDEGATYGDFVKILQKTAAPVSYKGLRFKEWNISTYDESYDKKLENYNCVYMRANYENHLVRFLIDSRFKNYDNYYAGRAAGGGILDSEVAYRKAIVAEHNERITVPDLSGFKAIKWIDVKPEGDNLVIKNDMTFRGYDKQDGTGETVKPEQPVTPSTPEKPSSKLSDKVIESVVQDIKSAKKGDRIDVAMGDALIVPVDILSEVKGKDVTINLHMNGYTWSINGKDIVADNLKDINLEVTFDSNAVPSKTAQALAGNNPVKQLSLTHNGDFGFKADLSFNIGSEYKGKYGNLYYYDSDGKLVFQNTGRIDENGNVSLSFSHASDYIVVITDKKTIENNDKEQIKNQNKKDTDTTMKENESIDSVSPNTGDTTSSSALLLLCITSLLVGFACIGKRAKARK